MCIRDSLEAKRPTELDPNLVEPDLHARNAMRSDAHVPELDRKEARPHRADLDVEVATFSLLRDPRPDERTERQEPGNEEQNERTDRHEQRHGWAPPREA